MLAAGLQGLQVAAVLHAGSAERSKQRSPSLRATLKLQGLGA